MLSNSSKKAIAFVSFLLFIGPVVSTNVYGINQNKWYVDDDGGPGIDFTSIQDAINASSDGDEIYVFDGFYQEGLYINKSISLQSYYDLDEFDYLMPIINMSTNDNITICVSTVLINGFKIIGSSETTKPIVTIMNSDDTKIEGNYFDTYKGINGKELIELVLSRNITISNNEINNYNVGISLTPHSHAICYNNDFIDVENYYYNAANIENDNNYYGLIQEVIDKIKDKKTINVHSGKYFENLRIINIPKLKILSEKGKEFTVIDGGGVRVLDILGSQNFEINGFTITNSSQDGIFASLSSGGHIKDCIVNNCWIGISIFHSDRVTIDYCTINKNILRGISIEMCVHVVITHNKIENNTVGLSLIGAQADTLSSNTFLFNEAQLQLCWLMFGATRVDDNNFIKCQGSHPFLIIDSNLPWQDLTFFSNYYEEPYHRNTFIYIIIAKWEPNYQKPPQLWVPLIDLHPSDEPKPI